MPNTRQVGDFITLGARWNAVVQKFIVPATTSVQRYAMAAPAIPGIAFMGMPVAVACPKTNGVCHNLRVMALETKKTVLLPQVLWDKLTRKQ